MGTRDARIDRYIAAAQPFARPILVQLRALVHESCPEVEETIKWGFPHFQYKGMLCSMAAFTAHCAFGFWRGAAVVGDSKAGDAMGDYGRITALDDLPPARTIASHIRAAMALNDAGAPAVRRTRASAPVVVPDDLAAALSRNAAARRAFEGLAPSHRREYVEWITEAKRPETRARRVAATLQAIAEGSGRDRPREPAATRRVASSPKAPPKPASAARRPATRGKPSHTTAARGRGGRGR